MKKTIRFILIFLGSTIVGFLGALLIMTLVKGQSLGDVLPKLAQISWLPVILQGLAVGILFFLTAYLHIILHEAGHLVCGLASGYRFVSFRIGSLTLIKADGHFRIKRYHIAGTGGQCLLDPPHLPDDKVPVTLYNIGGVAANVLTAVLCLALFLLTEGLPFLLNAFLLLNVFIGLFLGILNGWPLRLGGLGNDMFHLRQVLRDADNRRALMQQLHINAAIQEGIRLRDMPEEWFQVNEDNDKTYTDALQTTVLLMRSSRLMDDGKTEESYQLLLKADAHRQEMFSLYVAETDCELIYLKLLQGQTEDARRRYSQEVKDHLKLYGNISSSKKRVECAIALHLENDPARARHIYDEVCQNQSRYLMQGEVAMDIDWMKQLLQLP